MSIHFSIPRTSLSFVALVLALACDREPTTSPDPGPVRSDPPPVVADARVYPAPPGPSEPRPVNFPDVQSWELPNKLQILLVENHEVPIVDVQLVVRVGEIHDGVLAGMTASMLLEGTKKQKKVQIDAAIEQVGGSLAALVDTHNTVVTTRVLSKDLSLALGIVADVAQNPGFDPAAIDKVEEEQKVQLKSQKSDAGSLGQRLLGMRLYPVGHPYGRPFPTEAEIAAVDAVKLAAFHGTWFRPNNSFLVLSGDVSRVQVEKLVAKLFGFWAPAETPAHPLEKFKAADYEKAVPSAPEIHIVDRRSISTEIFVANLALGRNHPDWIKLALVNRVLGAGASSRLFMDLRETRKLTYNVNSMIVPAKAIGPFVVVTQTTKVEEMLTGVMQHLERIRTTAATEDEFKRARDAMALSFPLEIETADQIAGKVSTQVTYGLAADYFRTYRDRVLELKLEDVQSTAHSYLSRPPIIVLVGKASKLEREVVRVAGLEKAKIVQYDSDLVAKP